MNNAPLSVLLLAWDDADPLPAAVGGALAAGAALRAALAAHVSLTAILPQQPPGGFAAPKAADAAETKPAADSAAAAPGGHMPAAEPNPAATAATTAAPAPTAAPATAGPAFSAVATVRPGPAPALLALAQEAQAPAAGPDSPAPARPGAPLLLGLADYTLPSLEAQARHWGSLLPRIRPAGGGRAPAPPYLGSSAVGLFSRLKPPKSAETDAFREPAALAPNPFEAPTPGANPAPLLLSQSGRPAADLADDSPFEDSEPPNSASAPASDPPPAAHRPEELSGAAEPGAAEAADLAQWADDLTPASPDADPSAEAAAHPEAFTARSAALAALRPPPLSADVTEAPASAAARVAEADTAALAFRVIQYARFATQLLAGGTGFELILAAAWPCWLAATELRQRTGRPLVLLVEGLPSEQAPRRAQGWLRALEQQALRQADLVLVPSETMGAHLAARFQLRQPARVLPGLGLGLGPPAGATQPEVELTALVAALLPALRMAAPVRA